MSLPAELFNSKPITPFEEACAYEFLWMQPNMNFKRLANFFRNNPGSVPSDFVEPEDISETALKIYEIIKRTELIPFGIRVHGAGQYPQRLQDASDPVELLYYQGAWEFAELPRAVAVVGARKPSDEGIRRTKKLVKALVKDEYCVVSGLAAGVDTAAHTTAIENKGATIAVIGTAITDYYPKDNIELQKRIAKEYLLISQIPILKYRAQTWRGNRYFFPERNKTMSALTQATIIVEASDTSGTLVQARAALQQGRKLFILESCFNNPNISWPHRFEKQGAYRVKEYEDIKRVLDDV